MADTENTETSAQPIVQWTDHEGRKHFAGRGTFAHQAREAEEALAAERETEGADPSDEKADSEVVAPPADVKTDDTVAAPPAELTSTPSGRPAGPPKATAPKSS